MGIVVVSLPVTAVQMWIIAFKFVRASKVVHKVLGLGTAKNNATQNEVFDKCEFHPHGVRVCYTMLVDGASFFFSTKRYDTIRPLLGYRNQHDAKIQPSRHRRRRQRVRRRRRSHSRRLI